MKEIDAKHEYELRRQGLRESGRSPPDKGATGLDLNEDIGLKFS
jgi:hypothetical protein